MPKRTHTNPDGSVVEIEVGTGVHIGDCCRLGSGCTLGDYCMLGDYCRLGSDCTLGDCCRLGSGCTLGDCCRQVLDLGHEERGYYRCAWTTGKGDVLMSVGCHFAWSLDKARRHWGSPAYPDRARGDAYLRLIDFIEAEARARGWLDAAAARPTDEPAAAVEA